MHRCIAVQVEYFGGDKIVLPERWIINGFLTRVWEFIWHTLYIFIKLQICTFLSKYIRRVLQNFDSFALQIFSTTQSNKCNSGQKHFILHSTKLPYLVRHFLYRLISSLMPVAYHTRSFFLTVYCFAVHYSYSFVPPWIFVRIGSQLILW